MKRKRQLAQKKTESEDNTKKGKTLKYNKQPVRKRKVLRKQKKDISQKRLKEAADILKNPNHEIWQVDKSCNPSIHRYYKKNPNTSYIIDHLKCLRQCLLRRDWPNFCRMMSSIPADPRYHFYYPLFLRYGAICLAHLDMSLFHKLIRKLVTDSNVSNVLGMCTSLTPKDKENTETI